MNFKKGDVLYSGYLGISMETNKHYSKSIKQYHVTAIRNQRVFAVEKNEITWVKQTKKHFDYGYSTNIPKWYKIDFDIDNVPDDICKSESAAKQHIVKTAKQKIKSLQRLIKNMEKKGK